MTGYQAWCRKKDSGWEQSPLLIYTSNFLLF